MINQEYLESCLPAGVELRWLSKPINREPQRIFISKETYNAELIKKKIEELFIEFRGRINPDTKYIQPSFPSMGNGWVGTLVIVDGKTPARLLLSWNVLQNCYIISLDTWY